MADNDNDAQAWLDEADACHDADPARAAGLLRRLSPAALPIPALLSSAALPPQDVLLHEAALADAAGAEVAAA